MTDQNQTQDPQAQSTQKDDKNNQDSDVFGGNGDVFENSDILEPIGDGNKDNNISEDTIIPEVKVDASTDIFDSQVDDPVVEKEKESEVVETMPEIQKVEETVENNQSDDFFDPFNDDEGVVEIEKEEVAINDTPDFENSPEIDALDDLDELNGIKIEENKQGDVKKDVEEIIEEVGKDIKNEDVVKKEKINIESTIERIEKRAKEAKLATEKAEQEEKKEDGNVEENINEEVIVKDTKEEKIKTEDVQKVKNEEKKEENIEIKEDDPLKTDLQNKFDELMEGTKSIYTLLAQDADEGFDIVGGNDDRMKTTYNIIMGEDSIEIIKTELNKSDDSTQEYRLEFVVNKASLNVKVDNELLYDEVTDLQENTNKKIQVMEKLNKFIFLVTEEFKKLEKEKGKKEKRNIIKGIFRNFMF